MPSPNRLSNGRSGVAGTQHRSLDAAAMVGYEMVNPNEPRRGQRLLNALIAGGRKRSGWCAVTFGVDAIPSLGASAGVKGAAHVSPEAQLRRAAYLVGQGKDIGVDYEKQDAAVRALAKGQTRQSTYTPQQLEQMYRRGLGGMF
jgi:hypothetical protein